MFLSFPPPTKMFQFRGLAHFRVLGLLPSGLSHSEILGSILVCKSPRLIAAYHVFLRLPTPRHPPDALVYLFSKKTSFHPYAIVKELTFSGPPSSLLGSHSCNRTVTRLLPNKAWLESIFRMREPEWWA